MSGSTDRTPDTASPPSLWKGHSADIKISIVAIGLIYLIHAWSYNFISDDAFITLRYARNLAEGQGLVFNAGERVEGFSSPLWTLLLAGFHLLGCDLLVTARFLGAGFGLLTLFLVWRLALAASQYSLSREIDSSTTNAPPLPNPPPPGGRGQCVPTLPLREGIEGRGKTLLSTHFQRFGGNRIHEGLSPRIALLAPLILACNGAFACWSLSGMETMLYLCLIAGSFLTAFTGRLRWSAVLVIATLYTRPEGFLIFLILALYQFLRLYKTDRKSLAGWLGVCGGAILLMFLARYLYYGDWLPNTYYAKEAGGFRGLSRGWDYFLQYANDHEGLILLFLIPLYAILEGDLKQRFLALGAVACWAFTITVGGDGLPMYRFALPALPLLAILETHLVADLGRASRQLASGRWRLEALGSALALLFIGVHASRSVHGPHYGLYEYQRQVEIPRWTAVGKWLRENASPTDSVAAMPIGAISYYSRLTVYDMLGLTDRHIARRPLSPEDALWTGHNKHDGQYILSLKPTYLLLGNVDVTEQPRDPSGRPFIPYANPLILKRERDMYDTDRIFREYRPQSVPLAPGQYLNFYERIAP